MKLTILLLLTTLISYGQRATFNKIEKEDNFIEYLSRDNQLIKIGDTIQIGYPRAGNQFTFITQGNIPTAAFLSNTAIVVHKIKTIGNPTRGFKTYMLFKGYGLLPVYIDYEAALDTGEIKK